MHRRVCDEHAPHFYVERMLLKVYNSDWNDGSIAL